MPKRLKGVEVDSEANRIIVSWICHYGMRNADKISKRLRRLFILKGKENDSRNVSIRYGSVPKVVGRHCDVPGRRE